MTNDQKAKLAEMWEILFQTFDDPETAHKRAEEHERALSRSSTFTDHSGAHTGPDGAPAHAPKDDHAKAEKAQREEQAALRELLTKYGPDEMRKNFWYFIGPDYPDMLVLKFLRARKWNVHRAVAMLARCIKWRMESHVLDIIAKGDLGLSEEDKHWNLQGESGKVFCWAANENMKPVVYINVAKHLTKVQPASTMTNFVIMCAESFRSLVTHPNDKVLIVFNLHGFGLKNLDWHTLLLIVQILESYYPETLSKLYIHKAPWIFQGVWKVLSPMLDPVVRSKIMFTNHPSDLDEVTIDRIPKYLGGQLKGEYKYVPPQPNENKSVVPESDPKRQQLYNRFIKNADQFEELTKKWADSNGQDESIFQQRDRCAKHMRIAFLELDPLMRGKMLYHRLGILRPDGTKRFLYEQVDGRTLEHVMGEDLSLPTLRRELGVGSQSGAASGGQGKRRPAEGGKRSADGTDGAKRSADGTDGAKRSADGAAGTGAAAAGAGAAGAGAAGAAAATRSKQANKQPSATQMRRSGNSVYTTGGASNYESTDDLFEDTVEDPSDLQRSRAASGGAGAQRTQQSKSTSSGGSKNRGSRQHVAEGGAFDKAPPPQDTDCDVRKNVADIPGTAQVDSHGESPLAGYPDNAGQNSGAIAQAHEKGAEKVKQAEEKKKNSIWSKLNCFRSNTS